MLFEFSQIEGVHMWIIELAVVLGAIFIGARIGGIGIGLAGGLGTLVLALMGVKPGSIPIDVILIIMAVIMAIAAMQLAGGIDYLVDVVEKLLRKYPERITILSPVVTYFMTMLAGTGHTAYATLPIIAEVAKEQGIRPSRPLSIAVVASQIAITASPISAAVVVFAKMLEIEPFHVSYVQLLAITIPASFIACMITAFICNFLGVELKDDPVYQERLAQGLIKIRGASNRDILPHAQLSVWIFIIAVCAVTFYAIGISNGVDLFGKNPPLKRDEAIMLFMLTAAICIVFLCKVNVAELTNMSTFKSGMSACICVLGVAWMGDTFVKAHIEEIKTFSIGMLTSAPWLLAVALFFASMLLYSQAATTRSLMPAVLGLTVVDGVYTLTGSPLVGAITAIASFAAVSALFVLPTYPTLLAAIEMDETGSTRIGKYVFNHSFMIPGIIAIGLAVALGFVIGPIIIN